MTAIAPSLALGRDFDDAGAGEPALLFVPGWCGDRTVFDAVSDRTAEQRRTVRLDLPEHAARPRSSADFTTADVVTDAVALVEQCGIERVVPVALSHAGWAAIELRRRLGAERVPGVVLLDWMVLGAPAPFLGALGGLQDPARWSEVRAALFAMWTDGLDLPDLHRYVESMAGYGAAYWSRAGREIERAFTAERSPLAALERLDEPCPTLHVYAQPADDAVLTAQQDYAAAHPWFGVCRVDARSHFPMYEVPDELSRVIEEFVCPLG